ncbi:transcriptional regulator, AlpA family [Flavobacterium anhuiense]|uniref:Transcriptional regulator, AlpA family n=1 Tax=Flavobacterium anhuiense TaxID=459526 RepID=A0ABY0LXG6_9FLAO|nr:helix-turn-helix domain-containing protein [Flavobacterium anhuiense]SCY76060.1 transcriptional regulator, AlpA family [Flavobacterium anhuiense]
MKPFTFDQIPTMMKKLHDRLDHLERLIIKISFKEENKNELLNIDEASKLLNLSVPTIYSKVSKREIPVNKQGKRLYFYRHELMKWIKAGRVKTHLEIRNDIEKKVIKP